MRTDLHKLCHDGVSTKGFPVYLIVLIFPLRNVWHFLPKLLSWPIFGVLNCWYPPELINIGERWDLGLWFLLRICPVFPVTCPMSSMFVLEVMLQVGKWMKGCNSTSRSISATYADLFMMDLTDRRRRLVLANHVLIWKSVCTEIVPRQQYWAESLSRYAKKIFWKLAWLPNICVVVYIPGLVNRFDYVIGVSVWVWMFKRQL